MRRYRCRICGFVYEPADGDRMRRIPPGTAFEDLPGGWVCPICGTSRDDFDPVIDKPPQIRKGLYRHYKGQNYRLIDLCKHSETLEDMVLYQAQHGEKCLWVRPAGMWSEQVTYEGRQQPRFVLLVPDEPERD